jgi:outer membrane biosynthesis protein TonB
MSAVQDVQRSLNSIRALSADENAQVQQQILELMLQASISQLKSISTEPQTAAKDKPSKPAKPAPLPIPKPAMPKPKPKPKPQPQPSLNTRLNRLKAVKPQAPKS